MKYFNLVLFVLLTQPNLAFSASSICPEVADYGCLVKNSLQVYQEDFEQWWKIYHYTAAKARRCANIKDITLFLHLWSGETDGEMAEGLSSDTEEIIIKNSRCFFEGLSGLPAQEREAFISRFCPLTEPEPITKALKQAMKISRYKPMATQLLQRVEGAQCK